MQSVVDEQWQGVFGPESSWQEVLVNPELSVLDEVLAKIAEAERPSAAETERRELAIGALNKALEGLGASLPGAILAARSCDAFIAGFFQAEDVLSLVLHGSTVINLSTDQAQVDTDVETLELDERKELLRTVGQHLRQQQDFVCPDTYEDCLGAKTPSISFQQCSCGVTVRLYVASPGYDFRWRLTQSLMQLEPKLASLLRLIMLWADARGLKDPQQGTFSEWSLVQMAVFTMQTMQPSPMLPPLWRLFAEPWVQTPPQTRPMQPQYLQVFSSQALQPVLEAASERCFSAHGLLGLDASATMDVGLLQAFTWFLALFDVMCQKWQLSWNRRWRASTWLGHAVAQPFTRAFLVPLEDPLDPAENTAKSIGCESKNPQTAAWISREFSASLQLMTQIKAASDIGKAMVELFSVEVELSSPSPVRKRPPTPLLLSPSAVGAALTLPNFTSRPSPLDLTSPLNPQHQRHNSSNNTPLQHRLSHQRQASDTPSKTSQSSSQRVLTITDTAGFGGENLRGGLTPLQLPLSTMALASPQDRNGTAGSSAFGVSVSASASLSTPNRTPRQVPTSLPMNAVASDGAVATPPRPLSTLSQLRDLTNNSSSNTQNVPGSEQKVSRPFNPFAGVYDEIMSTVFFEVKRVFNQVAQQVQDGVEEIANTIINIHQVIGDDTSALPPSSSSSSSAVRVRRVAPTASAATRQQQLMADHVEGSGSASTGVSTSASTVAVRRAILEADAACMTTTTSGISDDDANGTSRSGSADVEGNGAGASSSRVVKSQTKSQQQQALVPLSTASAPAPTATFEPTMEEVAEAAPADGQSASSAPLQPEPLIEAEAAPSADIATTASSDENVTASAPSVPSSAAGLAGPTAQATSSGAAAADEHKVCTVTGNTYSGGACVATAAVEASCSEPTSTMASSNTSTHSSPLRTTGSMRMKSAAVRKGAVREVQPVEVLPKPSLVQLSSGRLQDLADALDTCAQGSTIDMQGCVFSGPLQHTLMKICASGLSLTNGELHLQPDQGIVIACRDVAFTGVHIKDNALPSTTSTTTASTSAAPTTGAKPAVLVTKQSYAAGGSLELRNCSIALSGRACGLHVKGKGCTTTVHSSIFSGASQQSVLVEDAALVMTGCVLKGGSTGLCLRGISQACVQHCQLSDHATSSVIVLGGALEITHCQLNGGGPMTIDTSAGASTSSATGSAAPESDASPVSAAVSLSSRVAASALIMVEGKSSAVVARSCEMHNHASAGCCVTQAGALVMEDCKLCGSTTALQVGVRGGRATALRCELSGSPGSGVVALQGATLELRECCLSGNGHHGVHVTGVGSMLIAKSCDISNNATCGVALLCTGAVQLEECSLSYNQGLAGMVVSGGGSKAVLKACIVSENAAAGLAVAEFGSVQMLRCKVSGNCGGVGVEVGDNASCKLVSCSVLGHSGKSVQTSVLGGRGENSGLFVHGRGTLVQEECELSPREEADSPE